MLEFNWGIFWGVLAAFAIRGVWRATIGNWMARHDEEARRIRNTKMD
jgi:hypothetical protein